MSALVLMLFDVILPDITVLETRSQQNVEQLERLRSEITPPLNRPMITHTSDSHQISCHKKTK